MCSEFHRKKLARRLLNAGQVEQQEQTFLQRLKQQCGAQFTQKMEGMNNDLATARDKQSDFEKWMQQHVRYHSSLPLSVFVCSGGMQRHPHRRRFYLLAHMYNTCDTLSVRIAHVLSMVCVAGRRPEAQHRSGCQGTDNRLLANVQVCRSGAPSRDGCMCRSVPEVLQRHHQASQPHLDPQPGTHAPIKPQPYDVLCCQRSNLMFMEHMLRAVHLLSSDTQQVHECAGQHGSQGTLQATGQGARGHALPSGSPDAVQRVRRADL